MTKAGAQLYKQKHSVVFSLREIFKSGPLKFGLKLYFIIETLNLDEYFFALKKHKSDMLSISMMNLRC